MGLFDIFKGKGDKAKLGTEPPPPGDKNVARLGKIAGDKHAQNYDRIEAIDALARVGTGDAAAALLKRFTFHIDPSITDQEEKDAAVRGVLAAGEAAIEPIRTFCLRAESLTWPLKILKDLVPGDRYVEEVIRLLERFDTEYTRNVDPKQQLIAELEHFNAPAIRPAVERFLEDASEAIRFVAVATVFAQENPESAAALANTLATDESVRVKNRLVEGLSARGWAIPEALRKAARDALPQGYTIDAAGKVKRG
jgi:HEAT repeat protein